MAELTALTPYAGAQLPLRHGKAVLDEFAPASILSIMPFRGQARAVGAALGIEPPPPGGSTHGKGARLVWSGREAFLLIADYVPAELESLLSGKAAVTDLSDGWAGLSLSGPDARSVLARLCPLDFEAAAFPDGAAARSLIGHVSAQINRNGDVFELLALRSYALSLLHEIETAMRSVEAQGQVRAAG